MTKNTDKPPKKRALFSVTDKTAIAELAKIFVGHGIEIISTGGTAKELKAAGVKVIPIEEITGKPEVFDGRMKTISFEIESALLFDRDNVNHIKEAAELGILPIDFVVCNLYQFEKAIANKKCTLEQAIEFIDIGGPTMIRAAAKNYKAGVTVVVDPSDYPLVVHCLKENNEIPLKVRAQLAAKAFARTADYEAAIDTYLAAKILKENKIRLALRNGKQLRYGENAHQKGWFYELQAGTPGASSRDALALQHLYQLQGKEISFNNLLDIDGAINALCNIPSSLLKDDAACVIVKHTNPCGMSIRSNIVDAYLAAWYRGDSLAAFGGIIAVNKSVDYELAELMLADRKFFEVLVAPYVTPEALQVFKRKKNLRVLVNPALSDLRPNPAMDFKNVRGGMLAQERDLHQLTIRDLHVVTEAKPTLEQKKEMLFAWVVAKSSKSNKIVITKNRTLIASGVGQQDRKRCCELCASKAKGRAKDTIAASGAFFPFDDGPRHLIEAGIAAIIQPGGSIRDNLTVKACNETKTPMVYTGIRCFRH